jgi:hypothetical protein
MRSEAVLTYESAVVAEQPGGHKERARSRRTITDHERWRASQQRYVIANDDDDDDAA